MAFAYIKYGNELDCGGIKKFYIKHFWKANIKSIEGFDRTGFEVKLPYGKMEQDLSFRNKVNERVFESLRKNNINTATAEDFINIPMDFEKADGCFINAAFAGEMLKDTVKKEKIKIADADIVIKDGGEDESLAVILNVAEYAQNLSVFTDRKGKLEPFLEKIYNESGLCVSCFSESFGKQMKEADIVINCVKGSDKTRSYKKGVLYIGIFSKNKYLEELSFKRRDMKIYGMPLFEKESIVFESSVAEAALRAWCSEKNMDFKTCDIKEYALNQGIKYIRPYFAQSTGLLIDNA